MKKQVGVDDFIEGFLKIMKNVSLKNGYLILPHFVRTIVNEDLKFELDREIGLQMKNLPFKYECLI